MEINEIKKILLNALSQVKYEREFVEVVEEFVAHYDGSDKEMFTGFIQALIMFIMHTEELDAKAKGFDNVSQGSEEFDLALTKLKKYFQRVTEGKSDDQASESPVSDVE